MSHPIKYGQIFFWKLFVADRGHFYGKIYWGTALHGGLMIRSCHRQGSFTNAFSSNLKTVNLKMFANHGGTYSLKYKALISQQNCESVYSLS